MNNLSFLIPVELIESLNNNIIIIDNNKLNNPFFFNIYNFNSKFLLNESQKKKIKYNFNISKLKIISNYINNDTFNKLITEIRQDSDDDNISDMFDNYFDKLKDIPFIKLNKSHSIQPNHLQYIKQLQELYIQRDYKTILDDIFKFFILLFVFKNNFFINKKDLYIELINFQKNNLIYIIINLFDIINIKSNSYEIYSLNIYKSKLFIKTNNIENYKSANLFFYIIKNIKNIEDYNINYNQGYNFYNIDYNNSSFIDILLLFYKLYIKGKLNKDIKYLNYLISSNIYEFTKQDLITYNISSEINKGIFDVYFKKLNQSNKNNIQNVIDIFNIYGFNNYFSLNFYELFEIFTEDIQIGKFSDKIIVLNNSDISNEYEDEYEDKDMNGITYLINSYYFDLLSHNSSAKLKRSVSRLVKTSSDKIKNKIGTQKVTDYLTNITKDIFKNLTNLKKLNIIKDDEIYNINNNLDIYKIYYKCNLKENNIIYYKIELYNIPKLNDTFTINELILYVQNKNSQKIKNTDTFNQDINGYLLNKNSTSLNLFSNIFFGQENYSELFENSFIVKEPIGIIINENFQFKFYFLDKEWYLYNNLDKKTKKKINIETEVLKKNSIFELGFIYLN